MLIVLLMSVLVGMLITIPLIANDIDLLNEKLKELSIEHEVLYSNCVTRDAAVELDIASIRSKLQELKKNKTRRKILEAKKTGKLTKKDVRRIMKNVKKKMNNE